MDRPLADGPHMRRPRYSGKNPRQFHQKYKELTPDAKTVAKVRAKGKTPAGQHVPILVEEILEVLQLGPGTCPKCGMALEPMVRSDEPSEELTDCTRRMWISAEAAVPLIIAPRVSIAARASASGAR